MAQKSIFKNVIYNFVYTSINLLYPLITAPYISRVLGPSNLGIVNFASSIINFFILFAVFGVSTYGVREVAKRRDNQEKLNKLFSELILINGVLSIIVTLIFYIVVLSSTQLREELLLFVIMSISIILNIFSIDWLFQGIEEYSYITIRNAAVKLFSIIFIYLFIKDENHYILYGFIIALTKGLNGVFNFIYSKKYVKLQFKDIQPLRHLSKLNVFFIHSLMINIYTNLDQILLGVLVDTKSVAFMNRSKLLIGIAISLSTAISNVTLPRASYYVQNNSNEYKKFISIIPNYILWFTIPVSIGVITLSDNIMYIIGGLEFVEASNLLRIMALTILFAPLSTYLQNQVLVATGYEKIGLYCSTITSCISLILNILLIPTLGYIGAGIVQVISEMFAVSIRYFIIRKNGVKNILFINNSSISYFIASIIMGVIVFLIKIVIKDMIISFAFGVIAGFTVYLIFLISIKEKVTGLMLNKTKNILLK